jgi:hypothetical protein
MNGADIIGARKIWLTGITTTLSAATKYYLTLERSGARDAVNYYWWESYDGDAIGGIGFYVMTDTAWSGESGDDDLAFWIVIDYITKLQPEYLLINEAQTDPGLQEFQTQWEPAEWNDGEDGLPDFFHEHSADDPGSNTKLQDEDTSDLANSDITGDDLTRGGTKLTMPGSAKEIDTEIITA